MSETGREMGIPRRRHPKKTVSSSCQHLGTVGSMCACHCRPPDLQSRFAGRYARGLSAQTIRNRLHASNPRFYRVAMTALYHQAHSCWCLQHLWNLNDMFSHESRFFRWMQCVGVHLPHWKNEARRHWRQSQCREISRGNFAISGNPLSLQSGIKLYPPR